MDDDQQFCLRWNNHQSTLISVFDTLLENGTLVDCTLAAEGKFLKAHKVVLSACSPYFATLLSQQYDKHPIFILKDVKFQELRAMMDYMYRGEVNISQDQLAALLKAAESLQIKGLSDSRGNSTQSKDAAKPPPALAKASELKIENKRPMRSLGPEVDTDIGSREGSTSPTSRKRKKIRRRSIDTNNVDNHDQLSNSSSHSMPHNASLANQTQPHTNQISTTSSSATTNLQTPVTKKTEQQQKPESHNQHNKAESNNDIDETNDNDDDSETDADTPAAPAQKQPRKDGAKDGANNAELLLEPKNEYDDDDGQPVEDLTLDDEELLEEDMDEAGPSHGGEGSSQGGYAQWQMERSQDEAFMAAQEAGGQHRDAQGGRLAKLKTKQVPTTSRSEADLLNDSLLSNENIVITKKDNSFVLLTKPLPHKPQQIVATLPSSTNVVAARKGNATTYYFKECEILAAKPDKKPLPEEKSSVTIQKVTSLAATAIKPIIVPPPEPPKLVKRQPRIKYSKHVNPATSSLQTQTSQQASIISQINIAAPQQPKFVISTPVVKEESELSIKSPLIIQQVEYDASASNTSQSADFSNAIIDGIDYSGIDDIELTEDVHVSFTDSISQSERSDDGQTTVHIHTIDDQKYQVLVNSSGHNRSSGGNSSQEEGEAEGSIGDDDSESRPHACCHCGKRYRWKSTLRRHESVECGGKEAAHQCPYCTYKAKQRGNLGVHIRKHHPEMPQMLTRRSKNKPF